MTMNMKDVICFEISEVTTHKIGIATVIAVTDWNKSNSKLNKITGPSLWNLRGNKLFDTQTTIVV